MSGSYESALVKAAVDSLPEEVRILPYAKYVYTAYNWIRDRRFASFMRALDDTVGPSYEDRKRFESYIGSDRGGEVLADLAEQAIRTRSKTALAALAILYADPEADNERKAQTALALEGISERSIDAFLSVCASRAVIETSHRNAKLTSEVVEQQPQLRGLGWDATTWVTTLDDLVRRGLLGEELGVYGRVGGPSVAGGLWSRFFYLTDETEQFERLLTKARRYLDGSVLGVR